MLIRKVWWPLGWVQVLILLAVMLWPAVDVPGPQGSDKVVHMVSFGWLMSWFAQVVIAQRWRLALLLGLYGGLIELLQHFSGYRYGDLWDLCADVAGVLLAWGLVAWIMPNFLEQMSADPG